MGDQTVHENSNNVTCLKYKLYAKLHIANFYWCTGSNLLTHMRVGAQWLSGRVLDLTEGPRVRASPASLNWVLEHDTLNLA